MQIQGSAIQHHFQDITAILQFLIFSKHASGTTEQKNA
jgi:hypothetical protein